MQTKAMAVSGPAAAATTVKRQLVKRDAAQWARILEAQRESTQTVKAFCAQYGIALSTYSYWRKRLNGAKKQPQSGARFLAVPILGPSGQPVEVQLGTMRVRVGGAQATRIVDALIAQIASRVAR